MAELLSTTLRFSANARKLEVEEMSTEDMLSDWMICTSDLSQFLQKGSNLDLWRVTNTQPQDCTWDVVNASDERTVYRVYLSSR
jgi:hypothetical protein